MPQNREEAAPCLNAAPYNARGRSTSSSINVVWFLPVRYWHKFMSAYRSWPAFMVTLLYWWWV